MTTVGRWDAVERLLASLACSDQPPAGIAIANQSGRPAPTSMTRNVPAIVVDSTGGASRGRNDGIRALRGETDLIAFPNDRSFFEADTLTRAAVYFGGADPPGAVGGVLMEPSGPRFALPARGTELNRWSVWRVIEPAMFVDSTLAESIGFREGIGTGSDSPWQAGEGTDLLLRILAAQRRVLAAPDVVVRGEGERRTLTPDEWRVKLRSYARGTGYVLRLHHAGLVESCVQIGSPWYRLVRPSASGTRTPVHDCFQATLGRLEGRLGRCVRGDGLRLSTSSLQK